MNLGSFLGQRYLREDEERMKDPLDPPERSGPINYAEIGRLGGLKGGIVRAQRLPPERRQEIARLGGLARHKPKKSA